MDQQQLEAQDQEDQFFLPWDVAFGLNSPPAAPPPPPPLLPFSPFDFQNEPTSFDLPFLPPSPQRSYQDLGMQHPWGSFGGGGESSRVGGDDGETSFSALLSQPIGSSEGARRPQLPDDGPPFASSSYPSYFLRPYLNQTPSLHPSSSSSFSSIVDPRQFPFAFPYYAALDSNVASTSTSSNSFLPAQHPSPREEDRSQRSGSSSSPSQDVGQHSASQEDRSAGEDSVVDEEKARKERRRATNRNSARAFRERQKAVLDTQQSLLEERDAEVARLRAQLLDLTQENADLKRKLESRSSSSASSN